MASCPADSVVSLIQVLYALDEKDCGPSTHRAMALDTIIDLADQARRLPDCTRRQHELLTQVIAEAAVLRVRLESPAPEWRDTSRRVLRAMVRIAYDLAYAYRSRASPGAKRTARMIMEDLDDVGRRSRGQADAQEPDLSLDEAVRIMSGLPRWDAE